MERLERVIAVALLAGGVWACIYTTNAASTSLFHLFYIPIIFGAWYSGIRGGLVTAVVCGLLAGPLMPLSPDVHVTQMTHNWMVRLVIFVVFSTFLGYLFRHLQESKKRIEEQNREINQQKYDLEQMGTEIIGALAQAIEVRDIYTSGHCHRVAYMACEVGKRLGLNSQELINLKWAGIVHDVGKIGIPEEILNKTGKLTPEEYEVMKTHPALGAKILSSMRNSHDILSGVRHHHERIDGKGYPDKISGDSISLQARIIAVCDVWDALTSKRSYRTEFPFHEAIEIMKSGRGTQFDAHVLDVFLDIILNEQAAGTARSQLYIG